MKNKEIARKKVMELEKEIKTEIINNAEKSKLEILREILRKNSREFCAERKLKKKKKWKN